MTIASNIFVGIASWAPSTSYAAGQRVSNGSNGYQCTVPGTSATSGGPSGTGTSITDGSTTWTYLAHVDYISLSTWASGIPATPTQPIQAIIWNCGPIPTTVGTAFFSLSGHATTAANNITISAAPGDSIRDILTSHAFSSDFAASSYGVPLAASQSAAVCFLLPASGAGNINYISIADSNVIIDGLQFVDPNPTSNCSIIQTASNASNVTIRNCVFDGYSQVGGASILDTEAAGSIYNCLCIDRMGVTSSANTVYLFSAVKIVNCSFVCINPGTNGSLVNNTSTGSYLRNCAIFGYPTPVVTTSNAITLDHCGTDATSLASPIVDGGGNKLSLVAANQFVDPTADFRIIQGSALISSGVADATDIPSVDDIARHKRVGWTPGAWEYYIPASSIFPNFFPMAAQGTATFTVATNQAHGIGTLLTVVTSALALQNRASSTSRIIFLTSVSHAAVGVTAHTNSGGGFSSGFSGGFGPAPNQFLFPSASGLAGPTIPVSGALTIELLSASGMLSLFNATCLATLPPLSASGFAFQAISISTIMSLSCAAAVLSSTNATASLPIPLMATGQMTNSVNAHLLTTLAAMRASGAATKATQVSCVTTLFTVQCSGFVGLSASASDTILVIACSASATSFYTASGSGKIVFSVTKPVPPLLEADAIAPFGLMADGTGLLLRADVLQPNMTSTTFSSGMATIPALSAVGLGIYQIFGSSVGSFAGMVASAAMQQFDRCSGTSVIPAIRAAVSSVLPIFASASPSFGSITASVQTGQITNSSGSAAIPAMSSVSTVGGNNLASGSAAIPALASASRGGGNNLASGSAAIPAMSSVSTVGGNNLASGSTTIAFSGSALAGAGSPASGKVPLPTISANGSISFTAILSGLATISLTATGSMGQINSAAGTAALGLSATGSVVLGISMSGLSSIQALVAVGTVSSATAASGIAAVPIITASGGAVNDVVLAQGTNSILPLSCVASGSVVGASMTGAGTITFAASGNVISAIEASVLVELEQIVATHATVWTTPVGYESGDVVVYWPD